jgi:hypothetical protein
MAEQRTFTYISFKLYADTSISAEEMGVQGANSVAK